MKLNKYEDFVNEKADLISSGIAIIWNKSILLVHGTGHDNQSWTIPKGEINKGEDLLKGALRETEEEIGIKLDKSKITQKPKFIEYQSTRGGLKRLFYFEYHIKDLSEIGLEKPIINKLNLQIEEVDKAMFFAQDDALKRCDRRMTDILWNIKWKG